ncbi:MAG: glycosyltransferase family 2 protein [Candidatus Margulisiibacteriota bacterium]|jgi:glycosyltransferase involved in cell wall biosynthesis
MKLISVLTYCYNEKENIEQLISAIRDVFKDINYDYEHIIIDNNSTDTTVAIIKKIALNDKKVKLIVNARNFGHIRSPYYGLLQGKGDAVIIMASDLQEPPSLIPKFIEKWEQGFKMVLAVKNKSNELPLMFIIRKIYYYSLNKFADIKLVNNCNGFGLYDKKIIDILKTIKDPYPYFRGLISEIGFEKSLVYYTQLARKRGITKNNFYTLYDIGMLGLTSNSKLPLRLATMTGFLASFISLLIGVLYLIYKLVFWQRFTLGLAPVIIGLFFFMSVILFFLGILGEYIGFIHMYILNRPLVIEKERVNFD